MIFFTGLGPLLTGKRLQLIAKASHRNGAIVRPPAILRAGGRTLHGDHLPAVLRFQQQRRAAVARQGVTLDATVRWFAPTLSRCNPGGCKDYRDDLQDSQTG